MAPTTLKQKNDFQILIQHTKGHQLSVKADKDLTFDAITAFSEVPLSVNESSLILC